MRSTPTVLAVTLALALGACSDEPMGPGDGIIAGVDVAALFEAPTQAEIDEVAAQWDARTITVTGVTVERDTVVTSSGLDVRVRIVTHEVDGLRHVGAVLTADGITGPAPIIVYAHGGDEGASVQDVLFQFPLVGADAARFVWVVPSFRSEALRFAGQTWTSQGNPSPWDRDVDDALSLLDVAVSIEPAADIDNVEVFGFSRGAGVGLLMGIRDPRVDRIVEFFGPTDFFGSFARSVVEDALRGELGDLPGLDYLDQTFLQPLSRGDKTREEVRLELVRRSAVLFADRLPDLQVHHGTADDVVDVSQAQALIDAMVALGRGEPGFQWYLYDGGTHNPLTLAGSIGRAVSFLLEILPAPLAH